MTAAGDGEQWSESHKRLRSRESTLKLLWLESRQNGGQTVGYTEYRESYRYWLKTSGLVARHQTTAGQILFVGLVDVKCLVTDEDAGSFGSGSIFLAVLGGSGYAFAVPCFRRTPEEWMASFVKAIQHFGGVSRRTICHLPVAEDHLFRNLRFRELARRCYTMTNSSGARCAGSGLLFRLAARWFKLAMSQGCRTVADFHSDTYRLLLKINNHPYCGIQGTRSQWFEDVEKASLLPLPSMFADVEMLRQSATPAFPASGSMTVERFFDGRQIGRRNQEEQPHKNSKQGGVQEWTQSRILNWARKIGPCTETLVNRMLQHSKNSNSACRNCLALLSLEATFGKERLERTCRTATTSKSWTVSSIRSSLKTALDESNVQLEIDGVLKRKRTSDSGC